MLDDYEVDPSLDTKERERIRGELESLERRRFKDLIKLKRDLGIRHPHGTWMSQAKKEIRSRSLWPEAKVCSTKLIIIASVIDLFYASAMALTPATAC